MLYIIATPIGNIEDISLRALRILKEVDFILAEDTRKTGLLLKHYQIKKKITSFYDHNEKIKTKWVIQQLKNGKNAALVSNAGTPTISDPGYNLIRQCREENLEVTSLPGASAVVNSLVLSGIAHDKFAFLGYMPRKKGNRRKLMEKVKNWEAALVFFESPFRILGSLKDAEDFFGDAKVSVAREMTKKFEEVFEGKLREATNHFEKTGLKGEFTVVIDNRDQG